MLHLTATHTRRLSLSLSLSLSHTHTHTHTHTTYTEVITSPGVRNFFLSLGEQWQAIALYLGYGQEELDVILQQHPDNMENQVRVTNKQQQQTNNKMVVLI